MKPSIATIMAACTLGMLTSERTEPETLRKANVPPPNLPPFFSVGSERRTCENCGKDNSKDTISCTKCGRSMSKG